MDTRVGWVNLADEVPNIGSGWRLVYYQRGRKWARMKPASDGPHFWNRMRVQKFDTLVETTERMGVPWKRTKYEAISK